MAVLTLSNVISLLRAPLALLFIPQIPVLRLVVLVLAGMSDYFDGFIARRSGTATPLGAALDPIMDKIFAFFVIGLLYFEGQVQAWQGLALISRDLLLGVFILYLFISGGWRGYQPRSYLWGKITTVAQYVVLGLIVMSIPIPMVVYFAFLALGVLYLAQLLIRHRTS